MQGNFAEPRPRSVPETYSLFEWPAGGRVTRLNPAPPQLIVDIVQVLQNRQSRRLLGSLSLTQLGYLLWLSCRTHSLRSSDYGFDQEFRPHPSAGAMHPIHLVCQRSAGMPWERYDPLAHSLVALPQSERYAQEARVRAANILPTDEAVLLALVAESGKTGAKYEDGQSLVWRDAGVVLGYLSLIAETLKLGFCPLGMTGDAYVAPMSAQGQLQGAGLALIGVSTS